MDGRRAAQHTDQDRPVTLVVGGVASSLINFRGALIKAIAGSHTVHCLSAAADDAVLAGVHDLGATHSAIPVQTNGLNPLSDLRTLAALRSAVRTRRPDCVFAYTIKPVIWSGLALRLSPFRARRSRYVALITGLGYAFEGGGLRRRLLTTLVSMLYRAALSRADAVIFQNADNRRVFLERALVRADKAFVVDGSGVDTAHYSHAALKSPQPGKLRFLMIARLLGEKGVREYAAAAKQVSRRFPDAEFILVGPEDTSPDGLSASEVAGFSAIGHLGALDDVRPELRACDVYVLPSYHEGIPRSTLEAMATGRPVLTTDVPGCRETVVPGRNGWMVAKADSEALAERMIWFLEHPEQLEAMGQASLEIVLQRFEIGRVNRQMLALLQPQDGEQTPA